MMDMTPDPNRISLVERMPVHIKLMQMMLGEDYESKPRIEKFPLEVKWANKYAKKISSIIDNPQNTEVRAMIFAGEDQKAAEFLKPILESEETHEHTAAA